MNARLRQTLVLCLLTLFSLIGAPGYEIFTGDHEVYIPHIYQALDPTRYTNDFALGFEQDPYLYFDELIIVLLQAIPLDIFILFFVLTCIFRFLAIYAIFALARYFTKDISFSLIAPLLFFFPQIVFGTSTGIFEAALFPRFMSLTLSLIFLVLFFRERYILSSLFLGFALLLHPLTVLPFLLFFGVARFVSFCQRKTTFPSLCFSYSIPAFAGLFLLLSGPSLHRSIFTQIDPLWKEIILSRAPYVYITQWHYSVFLILIAYMLLSVTLFFSLHKLLSSSKTQRFHIVLLLLIPLFFFVFSLVTVDILNLHFFAQLQLGRSLLLWRFFLLMFLSYVTYHTIRFDRRDTLYLFSLIGIIFALMIEEFFMLLYLPLYLIAWIKKEKHRRFSYADFLRNIRTSSLAVFFMGYTMLFVLLLFITDSSTLLVYFVLIFLLTLIFTWIVRSLLTQIQVHGLKILVSILSLSILLFIPQFSLYPQYVQDEPFMEMCAWIREYTAQEAIFVTEPFTDMSASMRLACFRSIFTSRKDGAKSVFDRAYALEWYKRTNLVQTLPLNTAVISSLAAEYSVSYILSEKPLEIPYALVHANEKYYLYDLQQTR